MRKFATLNSQNKLARHRLQVELWRQRQRKRVGGSDVDSGSDGKGAAMGEARQTVSGLYEDHPEVIE